MSFDTRVLRARARRRRARGRDHARRVRRRAALIGCAGLHADRVARACGLAPDVRIVPFRGEYHVLAPTRAARWCARSSTRCPIRAFRSSACTSRARVSGEVEAGPNAVLAFAREGYSWRDISPRDMLETLAWPGFRALAARYLGYGLGEMRRSLDRHAFADSLRRLVPDLRDDDLRPRTRGVRAQALARDGSLVDDFAFAEGPRQLHVLNAPSPAATACLAIGDWIAARSLAATPARASRPTETSTPPLSLATT